MGLLQVVVLALVQGITEFLPISSSAHLILVPRFASWPDQGLAFDVALNTATWLAVIIYFRKDITQLARGFFRSLARRGLAGDKDATHAWMLIVATVPVAVAGLLAHDAIAGSMRSLKVIGVSSIVWGLLLYISDRRPGVKDFGSVTWKGVIVVGCAQALALIPGTSRSGITITFGLFTGLSRTGAARLSFLLAVIVGGLAGASEGVKLLGAANHTDWAMLSIGFAIAFVSAYLAIHLFLRLISRASMTPFVVYRIALGVLLLYLA